MVNNRRFKSKRNFRNNRNFRRRNLQKVNFTGIRSMPSVTPRTAQDAPFNPIVVQRTITISNDSTFVIHLPYVRDILANQLGITAGSNLTFRILALDMYDLAARPFELANYDFTFSVTDAANSQISTAVSWPGRNNWPRVKLTWPKAISATPLSMSSSTLLQRVVTGAVASPIGIVNSENTSMLLRFHILWRLTQLQTVPTVSGSSDSQVHVPCSSVMTSLMNPDSVIDGHLSISGAKPNLERFERLGLHMDHSL